MIVRQLCRCLPLCFATAVATAQSPASLTWRRSALTACDHHAMVFDIARQRFVLRCNSTWEWDGSDWRERRTEHRPTADTAFGMVYDSARNRTVLVGGLSINTSSIGGAYTWYGEVWEYDGIDWTLRAASGGPSARYSPAVAYDPIRQCAIVFGGVGTGFNSLQDTWTWDGSTWTQVPSAGPAIQNSATMAFHAATGRTVLVSSNLNGSASETWTFDGVTWQQQHPLTPPTPRMDHARAWADPAHGVVRTLGGNDPAVWSWNGTDWAAAPGPARLLGNAAVACDLAGTTLLAGGAEVAQTALGVLPSQTISDTWRYQAGTWTQLQDSGPYASDVQLAYDVLHDRVLCSDMTGSDRRTFEWSQGQWHENVPARLPRLFGARMCHDFLRDRLVLFGGGGTGLSTVSTAPTDSLFEYDGVQWTRRLAAGPSPRSKHAFAFDVVRGEAVLFGGHDAVNALADTWAWNGSLWRLASSAGPSPRFAAAMVADVSHANVVLFGGSSGTVNLGDTWLWNGTSWQLAATPVHPAARFDAALEYDWTRQRAVLAGGRTAVIVPVNDQWAWDGSAWTQLPGSLIESLDLSNRSSIANIGNGMLRVANQATWFASPTTATVRQSGGGCGNPIPLLVALGDPVLGSTTFATELHRAPANTPFLLGAGAGVPPINLGSGCTLMLQTVDLVWIGLTGMLGHAVVVLPVPDAPSLRGLAATLQAAVLEPSAPLGFALTNGLSALVGD